MSYGTCKHCGTAVYWLKNARTGKMAPIDAEPAHAPRSGNILIDHKTRTYQVVAAAPGLFVSHFSTCPVANEFRRPHPKTASARTRGRSHDHRGKGRQP